VAPNGPPSAARINPGDILSTLTLDMALPPTSARGLSRLKDGTMTETPSALAQLRAEMARQHDDARATFADGAPMAARIAATVRRGGAARLVGIGASHGVNRTAATGLRRAGIDAVSLAASEALDAPPPPDRPCIYLSQSGESGEIRELLARAPSADAFGITLAPESLLARRVPALIGAGGAEEAFAATRSVLVSLAAWARICAELGANDQIGRASCRERV